MPAVIDGVFLDRDAAAISVTDDGLLRGDGVFEVIRLYLGRPWALHEHLDRMAAGASSLRLDFARSRFECDIRLLLSRVGELEAFLRLIATRGGRQISVIEDIEAGPESIALLTVDYEPPALMSGVKSLSYAPNMLAARLARERSADDALFVSPEGLVLEASRASFFYVLGASLFTPPLDRILDSITRRHLLTVTQARERPLLREHLPRVEEAFIASTTKEVLPVHEIDAHRLTQTPGPVTLAAERALSAHICASLRDA